MKHWMTKQRKGRGTVEDRRKRCRLDEEQLVFSEGEKAYSSKGTDKLNAREPRLHSMGVH